MKKKAKTQKVKDFMHKHVISIDGKDTVLDVCNIMTDKRIGCVFVEGKHKPRGIITESDFVKRIVMLSKNPKRVKVETIMSKPVHTISPDKDLAYTLKYMRAKKVRRLVAVSNDNKIQGIITQTDVTDALYDVLTDKLKEIHFIHRRTQKLFEGSVGALCKALDAKDHYTGTHSKEVARVARAIAKQMDLSAHKVHDIHTAGLFHDIGKIHVKDDVLNKTGSLTKMEFRSMKSHPIVSEMILQPIGELKEVLTIIRHHHESYDGTGYPDGLKGSKIPLGARVIAVADTYNAMRTNRPYRHAMSREKAVGIIKEKSYVQFDPDVVKAFLQVLKKHTSY